MVANFFYKGIELSKTLMVLLYSIFLMKYVTIWVFNLENASTLKLMMRTLSLNDKHLAMRLMRNKIIKSA